MHATSLAVRDRHHTSLRRQAQGSLLRVDGGRLEARAQPLLVDGDVVQHDLLVSQRGTHRLARVGLLGDEQQEAPTARALVRVRVRVSEPEP